MKRFFFKSFVLILGMGLISNLLGSLADRTAPLEDWRIEQQHRIDDLLARRERIEAITLGNSHSDALDYSVLGVEGQSLAFAAADSFEVERYADYISDRLPALKTVYIAISYYSLSRDNATFEPFRTRRIRYYSLVPVWPPIQGDASNFVLGRLASYTHVMSVVRSDNWQGVWEHLADDTPTGISIPFDGVVTASSWGVCSHYTAEQLDSHASEIANRNVQSSLQMAAAHPGLVEDALGALARAIERLQSKGIRVVLFTPAYYESYNTYFMQRGTRMYEDLLVRMEGLQQSHHVEYYDFSNDRDIAIHPELFYNSDHLGDCGHRVFTARLMEAMRLNGE